MYCYRATATTRRTSRRSRNPCSIARSPSALGPGQLPEPRSSWARFRARRRPHLDQRRQNLEDELNKTRTETWYPICPLYKGVWFGYFGGPARRVKDVETGVAREQLVHLLERLTMLPEGFQLHPTLNKWINARREMARGDRLLDWSAGESLALGSLAVEGYRVRLSGQDSARGTYSHRHAILHDRETGETYTPLQHMGQPAGGGEICNSPLSEAGVLGFEYGYSLDWPDGLIVWRRSSATSSTPQVIIDHSWPAPRDKWQRLSGLVMLLPHGFEGQGPEHSSARLERFLTLAAEDNIQVVNRTTPAQIFHVLRRHVIRQWRKPLIVMSPKSLLRHPGAVRRWRS